MQRHQGICKQNIAAVFLNHLPIQNPVLWSHFFTELLASVLCALRVLGMPLVRRTHEGLRALLLGSESSQHLGRANLL